MKKRLLTALSFIAVLTAAQAQDIKFTWNGTDLKDGDKIEVKAEAIDYGGGFFLVTAETNNDKNDLRLVNTSNDYVDATVTATIVSTTCTTAPMLQLCCGGDCSASTSKPIKKEVGFDVDTSIKAMMDADFISGENYGDFVTTLSAANNGKSTTITIVFTYSDDASIRPLTTNDKELEIFDLCGRRLSANQTQKPGIYIVNGRKTVIK